MVEVVPDLCVISVKGGNDSRNARREKSERKCSTLQTLTWTLQCASRARRCMKELQWKDLYLKSVTSDM
jgi:hypothetical protein